MSDTNSNHRARNFKDLTGKRFGKWTVIAEATNHPSKNYWICRCECGTEKSVKGYNLTEHHSQGCAPCGRQQHEMPSTKRHGMKGAPEYTCWKAMNQRCNNPNCKAFPRYGGNGIAICDRWRLFENFYADMGPKPSASHSIDRIDGLLGYSPENCRWATPKEQSQNRDFVRMITFQGETLCLTDLATKAGIDFKTLYSRLNYGWTIERALSQPVKHSNRNRLIEFNGDEMTLTEWASRTGISFRALHSRMKRGWSIERALTEPVKEKS